ncbi:MAG: NADPH-dependent FMN reductase [Peptococcaceae bacterium BRH_c4a]|nr:MAG: NADPH-dependent FMN reductase [Peptococcaceae bacterium BRH_c4a]
MIDQFCVALACSPRKNGNTEILLKAAVERLQSLNVETETIRLVDLSYYPCRACEGCYSTGRCVIKDDAGPVFEKILKADMLIMAAPVFSMGICAQAKMFIDRSQQFWATRYLLKQPVIQDDDFRQNRRGIFISCAGTRLPGVFEGSASIVRYFFKMMDIKLTGTYCYPGIDKKGEILARAGALEEIKDVSARLAGE